MIGLLWAGTAHGQVVLDVNVATADQLDALPGLGPAKARALVLWREDGGSCTELAQLEAVPGWGPATLAALAPYLVCGQGTERPLPRPVTGPEPALHADRIDINRAGPFELARLPGISLPRARDIVAHREANGPFERCAGLAVLPGIGRATVSLLADRCIAYPVE